MATISNNVWFPIFVMVGSLITYGVCQGPSVTSTPNTVKVDLNQVAQFECRTQNVGTKKVIWEFVNHNITISENGVIKAAIPTRKYVTFRPPDSVAFWNLEVYNVQLEDQGQYRCYIEGQRNNSDGQVIHTLEVIGAPPRPAVQHLDVTECCVSAGVESCALPMCRTNTSLSDLVGTANNGPCMERNLVKVLLCGQDGRNHVGCCIRKGLTNLCQTLCDARMTGINYTETEVDFTSCVGLTSLNIRQCLMEGQATLPSQPVAVSAVSTGDSLMIVWQAPLKNPSLVTGYRVQYRKKEQNETFASSAVLPADVMYSTTGQLSPDTVYEVRVIAVSTFGASQPSYTVDIATGTINPDAVFNNRTVQECCMKKNVSVACQDYCFADPLRIFSHPDSVVSCYSDLETISRCLAGEGDHSGCCRRVQLPGECVPLCSGHMLPTDEMIGCSLRIPLIAACMVEGANFLPKSPRNTHLVAGSVMTNSASVAWDAPADSVNLTYVIAWRKQNSRYPDLEVAETSGTQHTMLGLQSATVYEVEVMSRNDKGSSLPELTIVFVTEGQSTIIPYNETACCVEKGVPTECLDLCNHTYRLTSKAIERGFQCPDSILPMLQCAGDGRDHTDCCVREDISDKCLDLCKLRPELEPSTDLLDCVLQKDKLSTCFDTGKATLPKPPSSIDVMSISVSAIVLDWAVPSGPNVTGYQVDFSTDMLEWKTRETNETHLNVDKLTADTIYYFRVVAKNSFGWSLPTPVIAAYTLPIPTTDTDIDWPQYYQNVSDCCEQKVSDACKPMCQNPAEFNQSCANELDDILLCAADGRDHTSCCSRFPQFPEMCLPFCAGQKPSLEAHATLCMPYSTVIMRCFFEGQGSLPSPPEQVTVTSYSDDQIVLEWHAPAENCDQTCTYGVLMWEGDDKAVPPVKYTTSETKYTFNNLKAETQYRVTVEARNDKGTSLPAPLAVVRTRTQSALALVVSQYPGGIVNSGTSSVQLSCYSTGEPESFSWQRNKQVVSNDFSLQLDNIDESKEGIYTCVANFAQSPSQQKAHYLNVRYKPVPTKMEDVSMFPGLNQDAELTCEFRGHPDRFTWAKDGQDLTVYSMSTYWEPPQISLDTGMVTSLLRVKDVRLEDFGSYTCTGRNDFGEQSVTGALKNADANPPTLPPPSTTDVPGCCRSRNVTEFCVAPICTYAIDLNAIIGNSDFNVCLNHIEDFFICAADGRDHTSCCVKEAVPEFCLPFCAGKVPQVSNPIEMISCVQHAFSVSNCAVNGTQYIPSVPQDLKLAMDFDAVMVSWSPPLKNPDKVHLYHVYYTTQDDTDAKPKYQSVSRSQQTFRVPDVQKGQTYHVWMEAINDFGKSHISEKKDFSVTVLLPREPQAVKAELLDGLEVKVSWNAPSSSVPVSIYFVDYKKLPDGSPITSQTGRREIRLEKLAPNTMYEVTVTAAGKDGRGKISAVETFITGDAPVGPGTNDTQGGKKTGSGSKVGLAVGLTVAVLLLAAFGVVAVCFYRRVLKKKYNSGNQGTVAFENPRYTSTAKVTGLPGESGSDAHQFEFGRLHEEHDDHDNSFSSNHHEDGPATLNLNA